MANRRGRRFGTNRAKRSTNWFGSTTPAVQVTQTAGSNAGTLWSVQLSDTSFGALTVVRIRGFATVRHGLNVEGEQAFGVGIAMCTDKEVDAGGASLPLPLTDAGDDRWLWHWSGVVGTRGITGVSPTQSLAQMAFERVVIDSKAMRKWDERQTLCCLIEQLNLSGSTASVFGTSWCRILAKVG